MKKIILTLFVLMLSSTINAAPVNNAARPTIDAHVAELIYYIGGGKATPPPGAGFRSHSIQARIRAGFSYSCGEFNYHSNISQMINQIEDQVRQIPGQLQNAAEAAIMGLPGYLMMKYNPTMYNILTQTIDETVELFNLSYKSCKQIEAEMQRDPESNPYANFMQASVLGRWGRGSEENPLDPEIAPNIADTRESIRQNPGGEINWFGADKAGSANNPIEINKDFVVAGYNMMIGRVGSADQIILTTPPTGAWASEPVVQIWASPAIAGAWIQSIVGDMTMVLDENTRKEVDPGNDLRPIVEDLSFDIHAALLHAYNTDDYTDINKFNTMQVSGKLIEGLRLLPAGDAAVMMGRLSSEMAVNETQERVFLIKQMMRRAIQSPDMAESEAGGIAAEYIRHKTFPALETMLAQIHDDLALKERTVNRTTVSILNMAERVRGAGAGSTPGAVRSERPFIGGGVQTP